MWELYINDIQIELKGTSIALTKQINNFGELKDRQATFTNKFKAPLTPKNIETFNDLGIVGSESRAAYTRQDLRLVHNSVPIVSNGYGIITTSTNGYDISIYDGNILLFDAIGNKTLAELDLDDLNHELTTGNYTGSFANTTGYIYAVSDWGNFDTTKIEINYQLPSIFAKTIWDRIHSEAGFTYDFTPEDDLLVTPKRGYDSEVDASPLQTITGLYSIENIIASCLLPNSTEDTVNLAFAPDDSATDMNMVDGLITTLHAQQYEYTLTHRDISGTTQDAVITVFKNQIQVASHTVGGVVGDEVIISTISMGVGDTLEFLYTYTDACTGADTSRLVTVELEFSNVIGSADIFVNLGTFIGEMTQKDFIKDMMQHYALMIDKTKDDQDVRYIQAKDMLVDTAGSDDWSDRFIRVTKDDFKLSGYSQKNRFAYNYIDSDGEPFADGFLIIDNETLKAETTHLTRPYNASEYSDTLLNSNLVCSTPFWEAKRDDTGLITDWKVLKGKNYINRFTSTNETIDYGTVDGITNSFTGNVPRLVFTGLDYPSLLTENYTEINTMLDWNRVLNVEIRMDAFDFDEIDFFKLKYIKQLGGYFYLNKAKYTGKVFIECEIVNIPQ